MTSRSDQEGEKRPFSVMPMRAFSDRALKLTDLRVLAALGYHANRAGVCWPGMKTIEAITQIGSPEVSRTVQRLVEAGYVRLLNPNDYDQKKGTWGHSNRYQVLWRGDEPVPTWEEVREANLLQPHEDRETVEGSGARGPSPEIATRTRQLDNAWRQAIEAATGVRPSGALPEAELVALAEARVEAWQLRSTVDAAVRERQAARLGMPSFQSVAAELLAAYKTHPVVGVVYGEAAGE